MQRYKDSKFKNDHNALTLGLRPVHLEINNKGNVQVIVKMIEQFGTNSLIHGVFERRTIESLISIPGYVTSVIGSVMAHTFYQENIHFCNSDTGGGIP